MSWKDTAKELRFRQGLSLTQTAHALESEFPDKTQIQVYEKVKRFLRDTKEYSDKRFVYTGKEKFTYEFDAPIHLYPLGDFHVGAEGCLLKLLEQYLDMIYDDPVGYIILVGDLIENAVQGGKGSIFSQTMPPDKQKEKVLTLLDRFAKEDRILFGCSANHCERAFRTCGVDIMGDIFRTLNILDRYNFTQGFVSIKIKGNKKPFNIYCTHNIGKSDIAIQNKCRNFSDIDLFIAGHIHTPKTVFVAQQAFSGKMREILAIIVTSWMRNEHYAVSAAYSLASMRKHKIIVGEEVEVLS